MEESFKKVTTSIFSELMHLPPDAAIKRIDEIKKEVSDLLRVLETAQALWRELQVIGIDITEMAKVFPEVAPDLDSDFFEGVLKADNDSSSGPD